MYRWEKENQVIPMSILKQRFCQLIQNKSTTKLVFEILCNEEWVIKW
jgi:hypothetical protein